MTKDMFNATVYMLCRVVMKLLCYIDILLSPRQFASHFLFTVELEKPTTVLDTN